tara:strand:+ start:49 stop:1674 length:1626 start_codon:yes stop_codon:yes gene_type:complete
MLNYKVYDNQKRTAEKIFNSISLGNKRIHLVAPTQSGKTGTIIHLANMISDKNFILTSGMMDNHLFNQNSYIAEVAAPNIRAVKISNLLKEPNPRKIVKELNIEFIIIDENHFGIGEESRLDKFIKELCVSCPNTTIVWVGATGYQLVNSNVIDDTIQMEVPSNYYGVQDIIDSGNIIDSAGFEYLTKLGSKSRIKFGVDYGVVINDKMASLLNHLKSYKNGLGIIRVRSRESANILKESLGNRFPYAKCVVAVSGNGDSSIADSIKDAKMLANKKRVILIVCQSLKAGIDLGDTKKVVRFVVETYKTCASVSQGLVGRVCGYHLNRDCIFVADPEAIKLQAAYERDHRIVNDEFLSNCFAESKKRIATNFSISKRYNTKNEYYYKGQTYKVNSIDELKAEWFDGYNKDYLSKVGSVMQNILNSGGKYSLKPSDHPSSTDKINTIQSNKFTKRSQFDTYLNKIEGIINFSTIFHRFAGTSEGRRRGGLKGGVSNADYSKAIKVGVLYNDQDNSFYISVRYKRTTNRELKVNLVNKTIFSNQ